MIRRSWTGCTDACRWMALALWLLAGAHPVAAGEPYLNIERNLGGIGNLKALDVGDIVTILIVENASGNTVAKTDTNNKTEASGGPGLGILNLVSDWGLDAENKFQGDGKSSRTGKLNASISAQIVEVLPNGNYRLQGIRKVTINGEEQRITLSGIIRSQDLGADNTVASTFLAEADITYDGQGTVAAAQSPGLLSRILNLIF